MATPPESRKSTSRAKKRATPPPADPTLPSPPPRSSGFQVQIIYSPIPGSPSLPLKEALWFATYPVIPRLGDCLFHDGFYFRVDRVFLYESTAASWCADIEVSYYGRR